MLEEAGGGGGPPSPTWLLCTSTRQVLLLSKQPVLERGVLGRVSLPGTATVSKHETGTVTKQTTGALPFMVDFALRGGGGGVLHIREYISLRCALGGGRYVPEPARLKFNDHSRSSVNTREVPAGSMEVNDTLGPALLVLMARWKTRKTFTSTRDRTGEYSSPVTHARVKALGATFV